MCGFAGLIDTTGHQRDRLTELVEAMAQPLSHRGPDDSGIWLDDTAGIALAFRRLAIIDLTQAGHQPQLSHGGDFVLMFNGEIYNHCDLRRWLADEGVRPAWSGHSDTETLLACFEEWGVRRTIERTAGMFALAVWHRRERRLYLARDRFGEKPLYYGWVRGAFVFGSELKALRQHPGFDRRVDRDVLDLYMQFANVPAPYSIYENVYKLEPGCLLSMEPSAVATPPPAALFAPARHGTLTVERYWSLESVAAQGALDPIREERDALDLLESTLGTAVQLQSIADVPLGAFLSGGIDSSTIVALMQAHSTRRVRTFTIGFEEADVNEARHAKEVARHLGTDHTELYVSAQQARDVIPKLPDLYCEPFADSSQIPTHLVSAIARRHVTVALSGDGGDELFGGYVRYHWGPRMWRHLKRVPSSLRRMVGAAIQAVPIAAWDTAAKTVPIAPAVARVGDKAHKLASRLVGVSDVDDLYRMLVTAWPAADSVVRGARHLETTLDRVRCEFDQPEQRMMLLDALTYLPDDILHKVDRASMGVSLETRAPFLDHRVAELAWRLPPALKIRDGKGKWIVRQLLYRYVPQTLVERPKMGFAIPLERWIIGPLRPWAEHLLAENTLRAQGYFEPEPIRRKWAEHVSGRRNWQAQLWCVLMFQAWLESDRSA